MDLFVNVHGCHSATPVKTCLLSVSHLEFEYSLFKDIIKPIIFYSLDVETLFDYNFWINEPKYVWPTFRGYHRDTPLDTGQPQNPH